MSTAKKMFTNWRIIVLIFFLLLSIIAINPQPNNEGATIRSVIKGSAAGLAGIPVPDPTASPISKEKILSINNIPIKTERDYFEYIKNLLPNQTITIRTDKGIYPLTTLTDKTNVDSVQDIGLNVYNAPTSNIRKGLDLQGGTRVLLLPEMELSTQDMTSLIDNMKERLNIYGLSDLIIREVTDRPGIIGAEKTYILVEIAGASQEEVKELLSKQGKFEAKISNISVFKGGDDIKAVCRTANCAGIDPTQGCGLATSGEYSCRFRFSITLSPEAAKRQADKTEELEIIYENNNEYLNESLELYLDDELVDTLRIGADLKGRAVTDIQISGSGSGQTEADALKDALVNMKKLQTVLITGSLPVKLEIMKIDTLSPALGEEFVKNILTVALLAILSVAAVLFVRYRKLQVSIPIALTMISEIVIMLGVAALIGWNLDLAAIAGILIAAGTGVDDQIVITDETLAGETALSSWKQRLKKAFFIIMAAYFTTVVAMVPLLFAGAGLLKGFALTTIIGITIGVFITRPAYASMSEILLNK